MTIWDLLQLSLRFWVVTVVGFALTAAAVLLVGHQPGVFSGQVNVILLQPEPFPGNALAETTSSLISTTGVVAHLVGGQSGTSRSVSDQVTLVGEGIQHGYTVRQPNSGGQWEYRFETPVLDVQSAGTTLGDSRAEMSAALTRIEDVLDKLQSDASVDKALRIRIQMSPNQPVYTYAHGSGTRAYAGTLLTGALVTFGGVLMAERLTDRRERRRQAVVLTVGTMPSGADLPS
ncbi:MAG: hypothetical protein HHJ10_12845 [Cellulomonas sp.]|uniref:hypothetical protein n=1 Tax=Cellulomonas sp. TaxID=40001 RepID=UPI0018329590|nr:hypothetical protein [Cellulomonas sp.]NMM31889.1 hypothetical protein [Cellulomonas sp.]